MRERQANSKIFFLSDIKKTSNGERSVKGKGISSPRSGLPLFLRYLGTSLLVLALTLILAPGFQLPITDMQLGDVAPFNIKAKKDFLLEDAISTSKNRELARENTFPVYDFDPAALESGSAVVRKAFRHIQDVLRAEIPSLYSELKEIDSVLDAPEEEFKGERRDEARVRKGELQAEAKRLMANTWFETAEKEFMGILGINLSEKSLKTLRWHYYKPEIVSGINGLLAQAYSNGVVGSRELLKNFGRKGITLRKIDTGEERRLENTQNITDMNGLSPYLRENASNFINRKHTSLQRVSVRIVFQLAGPNMTFNKQETEIRKASAAKAVKPVFFNIKKGEMIVREGERIGETQLQKLMGINKESNIHDYVLSLIGLVVFFSLLFFLAWNYIIKFRQDVAANGQSLLLLATILLANFTIFRVLVHFAQPMAVYLNVSVESIYYALPFAAAPMLAALLFDLDIAVMMAIINLTLVGAYLEWKLDYSLVALIGGLFAVIRKDHYKQRSSILKNGTIIGLLNIAMIVPLDLVNHTLVSYKGLMDVSAGFAGGIMVTLVVSWFLPLFESIFRVNSDIKLQEISNLNHPLLRNMMVEAPGTYHHSIVVSTLAEGAAEAVGANPLLARVGAYYHDIGKIKKPQYFIENQKGEINKHDKLAPSMSALIITSHIKDGLELARFHKLNPLIVNFIKEHHGTSLIKYFYNKAKEQEKPDTEVIEESLYRYAGPKPQSKETAIVLLADAVEAASKSIQEPSVTRLTVLVGKIISERLLEGELEECDLTLRDLDKIGRVFTRVLIGIFHSRIEYPDVKKEGEVIIANRAAYTKTKREGPPGEAKDAGTDNIKKLKMPG